jgi:dihydropteroate synthase
MKFSFESTGFLVKRTLNIRGRLLDLTIPKVMGILNVTPDSFYDGNVYKHQSSILSRVGQMLEEGASIIDVGGYSTRPGGAEISEREELDRIVPAVQAISKEYPGIIISIDTFRSGVARIACFEGASIVNDVSGGTLDPEMFQTISELNVPYILMHMRGTPLNMASQSNYQDVVLDVLKELQSRLKQVEDFGIKDIIVDPGFGFAKNINQNFELLNCLETFRFLSRPILVGLSRKSFIWKTLKLLADDALNGTTVLNTVALLKGASILRVHDVKEAVQAIELIKYSEPPVFKT